MTIQYFTRKILQYDNIGIYKNRLRGKGSQAQAPVDGGDLDGALGDQEVVEAVLGLAVPVLMWHRRVLGFRV